MSDVVFFGLEDAVSRRAPDVRDLAWMRQGDRFELAVEVALPEERRKRLGNGNHTGARYELSVGVSGETGELALLSETFWLTAEAESASGSPVQRSLFPEPPSGPG